MPPSCAVPSSARVRFGPPAVEPSLGTTRNSAAYTAAASTADWDVVNLFIAALAE
ncbi:MAG: hypothetical protein KDD45_09170 [Bdellovibrionales bacterium]|nr:hypothetical protein [Bdellovibrionales bacterium]